MKILPLGFKQVEESTRCSQGSGVACKHHPNSWPRETLPRPPAPRVIPGQGPGSNPGSGASPQLSTMGLMTGLSSSSGYCENQC